MFKLILSFLCSAALACCHNLQAQTPAIFLKADLTPYLHQGDRMELNFTVYNQSNAEATGQLQLLLQDARTETPVDGWFQNFFPNQYFTAAAKDSTTIAFPVEAPYTFFGAATVKAFWRTGNDSGFLQSSLDILPQERINQQSLVLRHSGNYVLAPLLNLQEEEVRHASLGLQLAASPAAFAYAALPQLAAQPALPLLAEAQRLFAYSIALQLWRTQPHAARQLFSINGDFTDSNWLKLQVSQNIAAMAAAQQQNGSRAAWPGAKPNMDITAQMVRCIGRLIQLKALDAREEQKLLPMAKKGLLLLQKNKPDTATAYLKNLLSRTPKTPISPALFWLKNATDEKSHQLEKASVENNRPLCDSLAASLLHHWNETHYSMAAMYALLLAYPSALQPSPPATVQWGGITPQALPKSFLSEVTIPAARIQPANGRLQLQVADSGAFWALVCWQYAEATQAPEQKEAEQKWFRLQGGKPTEISTGSTISLGDTVQTIIQISKSTRETDWIAAGIPAGLRPIEIIFDPKQIWMEQQEGTLYAWLPNAGKKHFTMRMIAAHRGHFYSGAVYAGTSSNPIGTLVAESQAITIE